MCKRSFVSVILFLIIACSVQAQKIDMTIFHGMKPRNIGPAGMSGRVTAFAVDPRNYDVMYVGTASGGLWKSVNGGTTFTPVFDEQPVASIGALAVDPLRPDIVWAGTGEGNPRNSVTGGYGIYKSLDGGKTWSVMGLQATRHIHRILINPDNSDIIYAGAIGTPWGPSAERGVFKSIDGGQTWKKIFYTNETTGVCDMVMDPTNPDKIFVGMWNHQRWPWFFNSGGPGSGLFLTLDGGKTFTQVKTGLPEVTGRIGVTIAASKPEYVYAYIESKPSAIYRSVDGGFSWEKRGEKGIGTRPFYYAEIYADPKNENRVYTLYSGINVSEDGGLTFPNSIATNVHLDHHAWWINPENPAHMLDGNDGGMAITYDMGKNWRHIPNLPLGQFYHVNVDMEQPYRIYGGLQDNGSWVGPAYTYYNGGITNEFWDFLIGGDGFDAMPVKGDSRYCYAQSQGGAVRRIDILTGQTKSIRPVQESGERLRFNWNAAIAQDPFDDNTIYFGSQFVHKSTNRGDKWVKISPDLTTNDPEKQKQSSSGGITIDATGAETHCTVITISPSKIQKDLIWAGTDDGNVQYTTDGGKSWTNVAPNIKGAPLKAWIPQVTASEHNPAEAFVVLNSYRTGDYSAHLYQTTNYGKTWQRLIDDNDVSGYVICFVQDFAEPRLMFAGTEYGLYVSFDKGENWNRWTSGYPTVSTYDLVIHPRENDLIIGTFGRAIWVLDNIAPLRKVAQSGGKVLNEKIITVTPETGYMASTKNLPGYYYMGDAIFQGSNREIEAPIICYAREEKEEKAKIEILSSEGVVVKNFEASLKSGFNRLSWRFDRNQMPMAGQITRPSQTTDQDRSRFFRGMGGANVIPGEYKVRVSYDGGESVASIKVSADPRLPVPNIDVMKENYNRADKISERVKELNSLYQKFFDFGTTVTKVEEFARKSKPFSESVKDFHPGFKEKYDALERKLSSRPDGLFSKINSARVLTTATDVLTEAEKSSVDEAASSLDEAFRLIGDFLDKEIPAYQDNLAKKQVPVEAVIK